MNNRNKISPDNEKYVRLEVITNIQNTTKLSDARNTSAEVSDVALFNLDNNFQEIREAISDQPYSEKIAYKDNENKPIHVSELIKLLYAFDIIKYPDDKTAPIQSYSGKAQVFKRYKEAYNTPFYNSLTNQLPKLVKLYDIIESEMPQKYCDYKKELGTATPRFGAVSGVEPSDGSETYFFSNPMTHKISTGFILPALGAFRCLLRYDEEKKEVSWVFDPIEIWNDVGTTLVQNIFESSKNSPQLIGKDKQLWLSNYRIVETQSLRKLLQSK